jgi:hypothetical protein
MLCSDYQAPAAPEKKFEKELPPLSDNKPIMRAIKL